MAALAPTPKLQFFDANGNPLVGGKLYSYAAGTTTPLVTYADYGGSTPNTNPVILDSRGEASVWLGTALYKLKLTTSTDVEVWTVDNIGGPDQATLAQLAASGGSALVGFIQSGTGASSRTVQAKLRDTVSVKDFGAVGDGTTDDTTAIQAALNAGLGPVYFPPGVYAVSSEVVVPDGSGIIGASAHWDRRSGYTYSATAQTVFKYIGAAGTNTCVVRFSNTAVGVQATDFVTPGTDDLVDVTARDFHIDANNLADIGCYVYRAGNQATIGNITAEKAKKFNHVHLGCYAADFGVFGAYQSEEHGVACGWDIFSWGTVEATNFAYTARFLIANNGTNATYVAGTGTDLDGSGGKFSVGRGSRVFITSESNIGRACILSQYNLASAAGGSTDYFLEYLEGNADGPYIDYRDGMDAIRLRCGFIHPGNGTTLLPQNIKIEGKNNSGVVTANSGPSTSSEWLIIDGAMGDLSGVGFAINSNTYKYSVRDCTATVTFSSTLPAVTRNSNNEVNAGVYFTAAVSPTTWKAINGTLTRDSVGTYIFTFTHPFKTSGAVIPQLSVIVDAGSPYDTEARISTLSTTAATIRTYDATHTLADTGDRVSLLFVGELQ